MIRKPAQVMLVSDKRAFCIRLGPKTIAALQSQCPESLSMTTFCTLLIEQGLDTRAKLPAYRVGAGHQNGVSSKPPLQFPPDLEVTNSPAPIEAVKVVKAVSSKTVDTSKVKEVENRKKIRAKRAKGCDRFETFWKTYQSIPSNKKAKGQSKAKALDVWSQLVPDEISAEELQTAAQRLADAAIQSDADGEFFTSQPDCYRWLRDDSYSSWLEQNESNDNYKPAYSFL